MKHNKQIPFILLCLMLITLIATACTPAATPDSDRPASSDDSTPLPLPTSASDKVIVGEAAVETIDILILESFPVQVHASVSGFLSDGCTEIGKIDETLDGNSFQVTIGTVRPADAICTMALVPFETVVPLDVQGLPAGEYSVDINGVTATFTLDIDNVLIPDSLDAPAAVLAAREALAKDLNVAPETVTIGALAPVDWPNACLGVTVADQMCAEVITPGYIVTFEVNNTLYTYHTNSDGRQVILADTRTP